MKIRSSFVTNSSSSSFIITSKDIDLDEIVIKIPFKLSDIAYRSINSYTELIAYFKHNYGFDALNPEHHEEDPDLYERFQEMVSKIKDGYTLHWGFASNESDSGIEQMLYYHGFGGAEFPQGVELYEDTY